VKKVKAALPTEEKKVSVGSFESPWHNIRLTRRTRNIVGALFLATVLVIGGVWLYRSITKPSDTEVRAENRLKTYTTTNVPVDKAEKVNYYANLGDAYFESGEYSKALDAYRQADRYIDKSAAKQADTRTMNVAIASTYGKLGDATNARKFYELEIARLKGTGNEEVIKSLQQREAEL
jgi:tetratricopeptide (TPR) repeat protein